MQSPVHIPKELCAPSLGALGVALSSQALPGGAVAVGRVPLCLTLTPIGPTGTWALQLSAEPTALQRWQCWHLALSQGSLDACAESSRSAPSFSAGQLHNLPQLCSKYCVATGQEFQGLVHTRTNLPSCCLAAGPGVSLWAPGNGGVLASKKAWPASRVGAAAPPCWYRLCASNRSSLGSPGLGPGHRGGSSGDMLDTGLEEQAWLGTARDSGRWHLPLIQPGMWGSVHF